MKIWQRLALIMMIGSFPFAVVAFKNSGVGQRAPEQPAPRVTPQATKINNAAAPITANNPSRPREIQNLERGIDTKVKEIKDIDVKITETKGEIVKLEEKKGAARKDLEALYNKISDILDGTSQRERTGRSARSATDETESR